MMNRLQYDLLLYSFDTELSAEEERKLNNALAESEELRKAKERISAMRGSLRSQGQSSFTPFFTERVLYRMENESTAEFYPVVFRPIAIGAAALFLIFSLYNISNARTVSLQGALGIQPQTVEELLASELTLK